MSTQALPESTAISLAVPPVAIVLLVGSPTRGSPKGYPTHKISSCLKGTTKNNKHMKKQAIIAATNEVALKYQKMKIENKGIKLEYNSLKNIIADVKKERNLLDVNIECATILRQTQRNHPIILMQKSSLRYNLPQNG